MGLDLFFHFSITKISLASSKMHEWKSGFSQLAKEIAGSLRAQPKIVKSPPYLNEHNKTATIIPSVDRR